MTKPGKLATTMSLLLIFSVFFSSHQVTSVTAGSDSRLVAFLGNWQSCPTMEQLSQYTHIAVAFAVSYTYNETKNTCNTNCDIGSPVPVCNNQVNQHLVDSWRAAGKKVLLSFGGAGMGGSWEGDINDCWDYCFDKASYVVSQLVSIVTAQNFDGVDIDYEYFYRTTAQQNFLRDITTGLKASLPVGQNIVTHVPMDSDLVPWSAYYNILKEESASIDFIMPQYYNGITRPAQDGFTGSGSGSMAASIHYAILANDIYNHEPHKIVFGFCIAGCSDKGSNTNGAQAAQVMADLSAYHPCNGGAFFWVAENDIDGVWSDEVGAVVHANSGCSDGVSFAPVPTRSPVISPAVKKPANPILSPPLSSNCASETHLCGPNNQCSDGSCCSQWGYCGTTEKYCGTCCQSNCWGELVTLPPAEERTEMPTRAPISPSSTSQPTSPPTKAPVTSPPTNAPAKITLPPTKAPMTSYPTKAHAKITSSPTKPPITSSPTNAAARITFAPTKAPVKVTSPPSKAPVISSPTNAPVKITLSPTKAPVTSSPTNAPAKTTAPSTTSSLHPTPLPTSMYEDTSVATNSYHHIELDGSCGLSKPCSNGRCCSQWGFCGTTKAYCGIGCQSNCWDKSGTTPPTKAPTEKELVGSCGPKKPCSNGLCCSQWGFCGNTGAHCGIGCQSNCSL